MQLIKWYTGKPVSQEDNNHNFIPSNVHILLWLDNEDIDKVTYKDVYEIIKHNEQFELIFDNNLTIGRSSEKLAIIISFDYNDNVESTHNDFNMIADGINKLVNYFNELKETKNQDETVI